MLFYGVSNAENLGSCIGDVVEFFQRREEAEQFIAEVASEPNPEDAVIADALSVVEVDFELVPN